MQSSVCARCKKNPAVIFITKIVNGTSTNEGFCIRCTRVLDIKPIEDIIKKMGLTDEEIDRLSEEMLEAMKNTESYAGTDGEAKRADYPL